jgi:hypothetical protein
VTVQLENEIERLERERARLAAALMLIVRRTRKGVSPQLSWNEMAAIAAVALDLGSKEERELVQSAKHQDELARRAGAGENLKPCSTCGETATCREYEGEFWVKPRRVTRCKGYHKKPMAICKTEGHPTGAEAISDWNQTHGGEGSA